MGWTEPWTLGQVGSGQPAETWDYVWDASSGNLPSDEGWTFTYGGGGNSGIEPWHIDFVGDQLVIREVVDAQAIVNMHIARPSLGALDQYPLAAKAIFEVTAGRVQMPWTMANQGGWSTILESAQAGLGLNVADNDVIQILKPTATPPYGHAEYDVVATNVGVTGSGRHTVYLQKDGLGASTYTFRYDGTDYPGPVVGGGGNSNSFDIGAFETQGEHGAGSTDLEVEVRLSYYALRVELRP